MLDIQEIEATVGAMTLIPQTSDVELWVNSYNEFDRSVKEFTDVAYGYFYNKARKSLKLSWDEFAREINVSETTAKRKITLYRATLEVDTVLPPTINKYEALKGATPQEKSDNFAKVQEVTAKVNPTLAEIRIAQENFKKVPYEELPERNLKGVIDVEAAPEPKIDYKGLYETTLVELKKEKALKDKRNKEIKELKDKLRSVTNLTNIVESLYEVADAIAQMNYYKYAPKKPEKYFGEALQKLKIKSLPKDTTEAIKLVKKHYKDLAKIHHPDKGGDTDSFNKIRGAMEEIIKELNYE